MITISGEFYLVTVSNCDHFNQSLHYVVFTVLYQILLLRCVYSAFTFTLLTRNPMLLFHAFRTCFRFLFLIVILIYLLFFPQTF